MATEQIGYLYINGLGDGRTTIKDRISRYWWGLAGLDLEHAHINWYDGNPLTDKIDSVVGQTEQLLAHFGGVAIIGASAGGSLALNAFHRMNENNVCAVIAHGRLKVGNYDPSHRLSLYRRAKLNTHRPSQSFYDSVVMAENVAIPALSDIDKLRLLTLTQLSDFVVPLEFMEIDGVTNHRSLAFGHGGGYLAHLMADRDVIAHFAESCIVSGSGNL